MDALTVFFLYVEKVETSLLHYRFIKSYYHACFMAVKACCGIPCKLVNEILSLLFVIF